MEFLAPLARALALLMSFAVAQVPGCEMDGEPCYHVDQSICECNSGVSISISFADQKEIILTMSRFL